MAAPNPGKQRESWARLDKLFLSPAQGQVAPHHLNTIRNLSSGQTASFSIHKAAERKGVAFENIDASYDDLEKGMLEEYFEFLQKRQGCQFLHWNMRDANYGFQAIEHRCEVLKGKPFVVPDAAKIDLSRLLVDIYGEGYSGHPRLQALMERNGMEVLDFLNGEQEAVAFDAKNFAALHQSTLRKSHVIANIAQKAHYRQLRTNATW